MRYVNEVCLIIATFADLFIKCACLILTNISFELSFTLLKKRYRCIMEYLHIYKKSWQWMLALGFACLHYVSSSSVKIIYMVLKLVVKDTWGVLKKEQRSPTHNSLQNKVYKIYDARLFCILQTQIRISLR